SSCPPVDPLLTRARDQRQNRQLNIAICRYFKPSDGLEPSTPSLPWRFSGVTRVHARSLATQFLLQIGMNLTAEMRRETSRVSFLMCPFCVRAPSSELATLRRCCIRAAPVVVRRSVGAAGFAG